MSACDECRNDFDAMSRLVESLPDDMKTSDCVSNAKMLLVALAYQKVEKENAELRESLEYANNEWEKESMEYLRTQDQNAKLRELVKDLYDVAEFSINYFGDTYDIRKRMDALGVEVEA